MKKLKVIAILLSLSFILTSCNIGSNKEKDENTSDSSAQVETVDESDMFTDRDYDVSYDESNSAHITLSKTTASSDSNDVTISGSTVTITDEGTYILSGSLTDGMIIVEAEDTDKIQLVLDGVNITSESSAAIYVRSADKVFITLAQDSENTLSNGGEYEAIDDNNIDSVIFSKDDLTLNGNGTLTINAKAGHGIVSKDDLVITSGTYNITSLQHGLCANDSIRIANGSFNITAQKDALHAENDEDTSLGFVYIANGDFNVTADYDGISSGSYTQINDGTFSIATGKDSNNSSTSSDSRKGIKANGDLLIKGGSFTINSADDAVHSNANIKIDGGEFNISTGDDGFHADADLSINAGTIEITKSHEGLEAQTINISGGKINIEADDDGLNAAGGNDSSGFEGFGGQDSFSSSSDAVINISGGEIYINSGGDGVDSNGEINVSGGYTVAFGSTDGGNSALDYEANATITGGTFIAVGNSQMAQNFGSASTQGSMLVTVNSGNSSDKISLTDESGNEIVSLTAKKTFNSVLISSPEIKDGSSYTLTVNGNDTQITMDGLIYGSGMGAFGGGAPGGSNMNGAGGSNMQPPDGQNTERPSGNRMR